MQDVPPKDYHQPIPHDQSDRSRLPFVEQEVAFFEKQITSLHNLMRGKNQLPSFDAVRRAAEEVDGRFTARNLPPNLPDSLQHRLPEYGKRRILAVETVLCELGYLSRQELDQGFDTVSHLGDSAQLLSNPAFPNVSYTPEIDKETYATPQYHVGDSVQVTTELKPGHIRTPVYLLGKKGKIINCQGHFLSPEDLAHFKPQVTQLPLYLVEFTLAEVWQTACPPQSAEDKIRAEIYEPWLSLAQSDSP
ncbi:MAG: SH3-like domain-containing protein [Cyanobacteria bacterium J06632_22]